ncbi:MAG: MgtC/SapB family protein [Oscillospiraceae bacterium]|nr:MgtC/SapB family protein [Oscillospiraceae bacterium]
MDIFGDLFNGAIPWGSIAVRVVVAAVVGIMVGIERELSNHPAGMKTHSLVCLGAAITSIISQEMGFDISMSSTAVAVGAKVDISRIASGVVSGIGFIGAGAIIKSKDGSVVTGITTAATVWISGCMGLAIGMGYYRVTLIAFVMVMISTLFLKQFEERFIKNRGTRRLVIVLGNKSATLPLIEEYFDRKQIVVTSFDCIGSDEEDKRYYFCKYFLRIPKSVPFMTVVKDLAKLEDVCDIYESNAPVESKHVEKK